MDRIVFESVGKIFRHRPALFNWFGQERGGETVALKDVSFSAARAEVLVLLGPNGSGKTTALKLISTMLLPRRIAQNPCCPEVANPQNETVTVQNP